MRISERATTRSVYSEGVPLAVNKWPHVGRDALQREAHELLQAGTSVLLAGPTGSGKTSVARMLSGRLEAGGERVIRLVASIGQALPPLGDARYVVIDDIQHLDPDNAALVHGWVHDADARMIATFRTGFGHTLPSTVDALWRANAVVRIECPPLDRAAVDELLDAVLDGPIDAATRRRIWELTLGAPLYLRELVTAALRAETLSDATGIWRVDDDLVSPALDEFVADRVRLLAPAVRRAVEYVALGEPIGVHALADTVGAQVLADAEDAGMIACVDDDRRRELRMAHPLVGDVVQRLIPASRVAEMCGELLRLAEQMPMRRRSDIVRTVTLQLRAGGTTVSDDMVLAARRALYDRHDRLALELARRATDDRPVAATLVASAALSNDGRYGSAEALLRELAGTPNDMETALIAVQRAEALFWGLGAADQALNVLADGESRLPPGDWRCELTAERAVLTAMQGHLCDAAELCRTLADETAARVVVTAAIAGSVAMALGTRPDDAIALSRRALELSDQLSDQPFLTPPAMHLVAEALAKTEAGRLDDALSVASTGHELALAAGARDGQAWFALTLGRVQMMKGDVDAARRSFVEAVAAFGQLHSPGPQRWALAGLVLVDAAVGDSDAVELHWARLSSLPDHPAMMMHAEVRRAEAWRLRLAGDRQAAADVLFDTAEGANRLGQEALAIGALHDIVRLDLVDRRFTEDTWAAVAEPQGLLSPARRRLGLAAATGDGDSAQQAAADLSAAGSALFAAEADLLAARLFRRTGRARDSAAAVRRVADRQRELGVEWFLSLDLPVSPVALTAREQQVADLAALGRSNREVAAELGISVRTAENHLQGVFTKLGIDSRTDLRSVLG